MANDKNIKVNFDFFDDITVLRFLRARKFDMDKTHLMVTNFISWRKDFGTDEIESFEFNEVLQVKAIYPHGYHKTDKMGRPIYIEVIGAVDVAELFKITSEDRMMKYYVKEYEKTLKYRFPACSKDAGTLIQQSLTIMDVKWEATKFMWGKTKEFAQIAAKIAQDYYPEMLGMMCIVNSPFAFRAVWAIAKTFLDEKTQKKIQMIDVKKLTNFIVKENLPAILGGDCTCSFVEGGCLYSDVGPWNTKGVWGNIDGK